MSLIIPTFVVIHHSQTKDSGTVSWQAIRRYHVMECGWNEIGYHYGIELVNDKYEILIGRFEGEVGAHCKEEGMNRRSIGICMVGNFDNDYPDMAQWNCTLELVANILIRYNLPIERIKGHRDYAPYKSCPGKKFDMNKFRSDVQSNL